jgi:cyclic beta-1,2-glucan synthetase
MQAWITEHELALEQRLEVSTTPLADTVTPAAAPTTLKASSRPSPGSSADVGAAQRPTRPWINVLSNPLRCAGLEAGGGYTCREQPAQPAHRLVERCGGRPGERKLLIQDLRSHALWQVTPGQRGGRWASGYRVAHGQGYTVISHHRGRLRATVPWCVDPQRGHAVRLRLVNSGTARCTCAYRYCRMDDGCESCRPQHGPTALPSARP